jgi:hypothetical protein
VRDLVPDTGDAFAVYLQSDIEPRGTAAGGLRKKSDVGASASFQGVTSIRSPY